MAKKNYNNAKTGMTNIPAELRSITEDGVIADAKTIIDRDYTVDTNQFTTTEVTAMDKYEDNATVPVAKQTIINKELNRRIATLKTAVDNLSGGSAVFNSGEAVSDYSISEDGNSSTDNDKIPTLAKVKQVLQNNGLFVWKGNISDFSNIQVDSYLEGWVFNVSGIEGGTVEIPNNIMINPATGLVDTESITTTEVPVGTNIVWTKDKNNNYGFDILQGFQTYNIDLSNYATNSQITAVKKAVVNAQNAIEGTDDVLDFNITKSTADINANGENEIIVTNDENVISGIEGSYNKVQLTATTSLVGATIKIYDKSDLTTALDSLTTTSVNKTLNVIVVPSLEAGSTKTYRALISYTSDGVKFIKFKDITITSQYPIYFGLVQKSVTKSLVHMLFHTENEQYKMETYYGLNPIYLHALYTNLGVGNYTLEYKDRTNYANETEVDACVLVFCIPIDILNSAFGNVQPTVKLNGLEVPMTMSTYTPSTVEERTVINTSYAILISNLNYSTPNGIDSKITLSLEKKQYCNL